MIKTPPNSNDNQQRMNTLLEEFQKQSDRGAAIVATAWVDESISIALESFLRDESTSWKRLFTGNGSLANFSSKIDLCHLLGLISSAIHSDLHIIRKIRNEFAHQVAHKTMHTKLTFSTAHVKNMCLDLKCVAHEKHIDPRVAFLRACAILSSDFETTQFIGIKISGSCHIFARIEYQQK